MRERPGSPRARLFLALDPPDEAREALSVWRDGLIADRTDLRAVRPEALHVTLVFLGYQPEKQVAAIAEAAFGMLEGLRPTRLTPTEVKPLPPRRPRLFALDLDDEDGRASAVQAAAQEALVTGGWYRPEKRPFWPHMTLARVKRDRRAEPLPVTQAPPGPFEAQDVVLYQSTLRPQGAEYAPLARFSLSG